MQRSSSHRPLIPSGLRLQNWFFGIWTFLVFVFLYLPIILLVIYSFNASELSTVWEGFTTEWYSGLIDDPNNDAIRESLLNSLFIAAVTTAFSVVIGTVGAWMLHRYSYKFSRAIQTLICIPMIMPEIVMGISLLIFFTASTIPLGFSTVIISHITFCFPFVLVAVQARLQGLDPSLEEAALDLGASPLKAFWLVIVPCLRPAVLSGALMSFTLSMDEIIVTFFTRGPNSPTLPTVVFGMVKKGLNPSINALSAVFIITTFALVIFSEHVKKLARR